MQSDRRRFLAASATGLFGFEQFLELAMAQTGTDAPKFAPGVVDFWADAMGISPDSLLGGAATRGRKTSQGPSATAIDYAREPLFLQYDADEKTLITSDQIPNARLMPSGDTQVQLQLSRMRLNPDDTKMFHSYTSGGIYVDMQQHPFTQPQGFFGTLQSLATSAFSAIQPPAAGGGRGGKAGGKSAAAKGPPSASGKTAMVAAAPSSSGAQAIPMQNASQAQSLALPAGKGKTAFLAFVKDRKLSAFGTFLSAFEQLAGAGAAFIPLLNLPVVGTATLGAVRGLVANLQAHGGDHLVELLAHRGLHPVDLHDRHRGPVVPGVCHHAERGGGGLGDYLADPHAHDVRAAIEIGGRNQARAPVFAHRPDVPGVAGRL